MDRRLAPAIALVALVLTLGCKQEEGEVCQRYDSMSDCAEGLVCCGAVRVCPGDPADQANVRGICTPTGMCPEMVERVCPDPDAGQTDSGPADSGPAEVDAGPTDAGPTDAGPTDAGPTDAGPTDAGPTDAGPTDAGPTDAGPTDAGTDAGVDAGS